MVTASIVDSFKRSFRLIKGWGWSLFARLLFILVLVTIIALISVVPQLGPLVSSALALLLSIFTVFYLGLTYEDLVGIEQNKIIAKESVSIWKKVLFVIAAIVLFFSLAIFSSLADFVQQVMANNTVQSTDILY